MAAEGGPNLFNTATMDALRTCAARFTCITEYGVRFMWSEVIFGKSFKLLASFVKYLCYMAPHDVQAIIPHQSGTFARTRMCQTISGCFN